MLAWIKAHGLSVLLALALIGAVVGILAGRFELSELKKLNSRLVDQNRASLELVGKLNANIDKFESDIGSIRSNNQKLERNNIELKRIIDAFGIGFAEAKRIIESAKHR